MDGGWSCPATSQRGRPPQRSGHGSPPRPRGALTIERWEGGVIDRGLAILCPALTLADGTAWIDARKGNSSPSVPALALIARSPPDQDYEGESHPRISPPTS